MLVCTNCLKEIPADMPVIITPLHPEAQFCCMDCFLEYTKGDDDGDDDM